MIGTHRACLHPKEPLARGSVPLRLATVSQSEPPPPVEGVCKAGSCGILTRRAQFLESRGPSVWVRSPTPTQNQEAHHVAASHHRTRLRSRLAPPTGTQRFPGSAGSEDGGHSSRSAPSVCPTPGVWSVYFAPYPFGSGEFSPGVGLPIRFGFRRKTQDRRTRPEGHEEGQNAR